jgi:hypothetical protein
MQAGLIASVTQVNLERIELTAMQLREFGGL